MYYHCDKCKAKFAGHNKKAMQLNADQYVGYFNFYLGERGYAVDEELYSYIIHEATSESTAVIHQRIHNMTADAYVNDYYKYLHTMGANKVVFSKRGKVTTYDTQQSTLDHHFVAAGSPNVRTSVSDLRDEIRNLKYKVDHATSVSDGDIQLSEVIELKRNNNCVDPPLKGIGESKLRQLIAAGCCTMGQLIDLDPGDLHVKNSHTKLARWKAIARGDLQKQTREKERLEAVLARREEDLILEQVVQDADEDPLGDNEVNKSTEEEEDDIYNNTLPPCSVK